MRIIGGTFKNRPLVTPKGQNTRPTSSRLREALFNICQHQIEGADFLDLFAGSGAMGLEALSRGAASSTFVDSSKESIHCIEKNCVAFGVVDQARVIRGDVFKVVEELISKGKQYSIIYVDPPYAAKVDGVDFGKVLLCLVDRSALLGKGGRLFIESGKPLECEELQSLECVSTRKTGKSYLSEYRKH